MLRDNIESAAVFTALGDPIRLHILDRLADGIPLSIARLTQSTPFTRQAITKHLAVLADAGLVRDDKAGRERLWELRPQQITAARQALEKFERAWDRRLAALKKHVARETR